LQLFGRKPPHRGFSRAHEAGQTKVGNRAGHARPAGSGAETLMPRARQ
jgi:hypothetical protein